MADEHIENDSGALEREDGLIESSDVGMQSLTDALKKSFVVLKLIMVVVVVCFLASGIKKVRFDEQALILHFGKVKGDEFEDRVRSSGLYYSFPKPIDEVVRIPVTKSQDLEIKTFWYFQTPQEEASGKMGWPPEQLDPLKDGYCLARNDSSIGSVADYGILHAKWNMVYTIADIELFFSNIYYRSPEPGEDFYDVVQEDVVPLLRVIAEDAIVTTTVNYSIDDAISNRLPIVTEVKRRLQDKLDSIDSGIKVDAMQITALTWPRQVDDEFEAASKASQERDELETVAKGEAETLLNEAGGANAESILVQLKAEGLTEDEKNVLLSQLSGEAQARISAARTYRTEVVERAKANAEYLAKLLPEFKKRPKLILQKIHQETMQEIMANADEKFFLQPGKADEIRIWINRDPVIDKEKRKKEVAAPKQREYQLK